MPVLVLTVLLRLARRLRPLSIALAVYETWRRLPPKQREQLLVAARRSAPRLASALARRARPVR